MTKINTRHFDQQTKLLDVVVIGLGKIAQLKHLPNIINSSQYRIVGICDLSNHILKEVGDKFSISPEKRFTDYHDLASLHPDLAFILNHNHYLIAQFFLDSGTSVFTEKPLAWNSMQTDQLVKLAYAKSLWLGVGYMKRHDPCSKWIKEFLKENGKPIYIKCNNYVGGFKRWTDEIYNIIRMSKDEKEKIERQLSQEWKQALEETLHLNSSQTELQKLLLQLTCHELDLLIYWFGTNISIENVSVTNTILPEDGLTQVVGMQMLCQNTLIYYDVIPLRNSPWTWKQNFEFIYPQEIIQVAFSNPFFPQSDTTILRERNSETGFTTEIIQISKKDSFAREIDWIAQEIQAKRPYDLNPAQDASIVTQLIEKGVKKAVFY